MTQILSTPVLVGMTLVYGGVVAVLGALSSGALPVIALVGALIVGGLWALRGVLEDRRPKQRGSAANPDTGSESA